VILPRSYQCVYYVPVFTGSGQVFVKTPHHRAGVGKQAGLVGGFIKFSCIVEPVAGFIPSNSGWYTAKVATNLATLARPRPITSKGQIL
jgi:hypothetical protein